MPKGFDLGLVCYLPLECSLLIVILGMCITVSYYSSNQAPTDYSGNGCQQAFYINPNVLYISIHVHMDGKFYPSGDGGDMHHCGLQEGMGKYAFSARLSRLTNASETSTFRGRPRAWETEITCSLSSRLSCLLPASSILTSSLVRAASHV